MRATILFGSLMLTGLAPAATFSVDTSSDAALSACTGAAADCSLRGALLAANLTPAADTIEFALPTTDSGFQAATGHWQILVGDSALPDIEAPVLINGYSQPGSLENTLAADQGGLDSQLKIELQPVGAFASQQSGLAISANFFAQAASVFRGLLINRFAIQITLTGDGAHRIEGCYLGTDITGSAAAVVGNNGRGNGVRLGGPGDYVIGGLQPASRNLISGLADGINSFAVNDGIRVQGNLIGTDRSGTTVIGNTGNGFASSAPLTNALIGGTDSAARNVFAGNRFEALRLSSSGGATLYAGTLIQGNFFGTDWSGQRALGNGLNPASPSQPQSTINLFKGGACNLQIGGLNPGEANLIAYGGAAGIQAATCSGVSLRGNRYRGNRGVPIDNSVTSNADGASANDANDADDGGNRLQNYPVITLPPGFLPSGSSSVSLSYLVDSSIANASYPLTVDFFRAACGGGSDRLLATDTYGPSDAQLPRSFNLQSGDGGSVLPLTVLVTDAAGNTSEFSPVVGDEIFRHGFEDALAPLTPGRCL